MLARFDFEVSKKHRSACLGPEIGRPSNRYQPHFRRWPQRKQRPTFCFEHFRFFCSHSVLPTKMTYGNLFIFVFLESPSGWPKPPNLKFENEAHLGHISSSELLLFVIWPTLGTSRPREAGFIQRFERRC